MQSYISDSLKYRALYNCSYLHKSEWRQYVTPRPVLGYFCLVIGMINLVCYVPCLIVICHKSLFKNSCYKIMFLLGLVDLIAIICNSGITGWLLVKGTCWFANCLTCCILALNRFLDFFYTTLSNLLFGGGRTYFWVGLVFLYWLFAFLYTNPVTLNTSAIMWVFDPFVTVPEDVVPVDRTRFICQVNIWNNYIWIPGMFLLYLVLIVTICIKSSRGHQLCALKIRSLFICVLVFVPGAIFILLQFVRPHEILIYLSLFSYMIGNGSGGVVLLCMNPRIRHKVTCLFSPKKISSVAHVTRTVEA
ncbi:hypothetical protein L596_020602 [Steinernema carpocapsae]|uniref:G-protein coupled receptors family 1 profile domain-containing protein n=1 Tax=Steinernema carpocapsae TaxID=34508 RepID=A0A4U5MU13_STECR|nr:hypothetical protein L596_020602 [Steinernema carpocapsae]